MNTKPAQSSADEITTELVKTWTGSELATALMAIAIGFGDVESARILREAATRIRSLPSQNQGSKR